MIARALLLGSLCFAAVAFAAPGAIANRPLLQATTPKEIAARFRSPQASWSVSDRGYGGAAEGSWTYATAGSLAADHYTVEANFSLVQPANRRDGLEMTAFASYRAHAELGGYEAALVLRHQDASRHYRVAVSSLWREVVLWRPTGGIVQVADYPFEAGKSYKLSVTCRGAHLVVRVDGKAVIDWWDTADPVSRGTVALARKEGEAYFTSVTITPEPPATAPPPPHVANIRERNWHEGRWYFDGAEPLFVLRDDNVLDHMKLLPGYRAAMYANNHITDWAQFFPKKILKHSLLRSGPQLVIETTAADPDKPGPITCTSRVTVSFNAATRMYEYDQSCTVDLPTAAEAALVSRNWDQGDPVFLGSVGSAETRNPSAERPRYEWIVFEAPDGTRHKVPLNHNGFYAGRSIVGGGPVRQDGGRVVGVGDAILSPVIAIPRKPAQFSACRADVCHWGYDVHMLFAVPTVAEKVPVGKYTSALRYTGLPAAEGKKLLASASLFDPHQAEIRIPVFAAGVGRTEPFDKEVLLASPHGEYRLWAGRIDRAVGRGDKASLRLDGPTECWTTLGPSFFMTSYGPRNRVSGWVRTRDVTGEGPVIGLRRFDNGKVEFHAPGVTGTRDWTPFSYVTAFPHGSFGASLLLRNSGGGTVWFDDLRIEPLTGDAAPAASPARPLAHPTPDAELVLRWTGHGDAGSLLDESGYGHHGKLYGTKSWRDENGRRVLGLDGKSNYIWPLMSPHLEPGAGSTLVMDVKPEGAGSLVYWGFLYEIRMEGAGPEFAIAYQPSGGRPVQSRPFLKAGEWQRLAIVTSDEGVLLYRNGELIERLVVKPAKGDWALHLGTTWHRHLSFFGYGIGDMGLVNEPSGGHWKGELRSLSVWKKPLPLDRLQP